MVSIKKQGILSISEQSKLDSNFRRRRYASFFILYLIFSHISTRKILFNGKNKHYMNVKLKKENNMTKLTSSELANRLWEMANGLRGNIDASEFKDYILGLMFYRFLSDRSKKLVKKALKIREDKFDYNTEYYKNQKLLDEVVIEKLGCIVRPEYTFDKIMEKIANKTFTIEDLQTAFNEIEKTTKDGGAAEAAYKNLLNGSVDLNSNKLGDNVNTRSHIIAKVLTEIDKIYSDYENSDFDILGRSYEILIGDFAASAGKKGGEFYTPECMQKLVCQLASYGFNKVDAACDPTCGSASMLIKLKDYVEVEHYFGTELNSTTEKLARMNMILHGIDFDKFDVRQGNTLKTPDLAEGEQYQVVVANPPYSAHWEPSEAMEDPRFAFYGKPAPRTKADFAFVQHIIYHLAENGRAAILLPHGVLFRSSAESLIRKTILENNLIDAIIGLPANCFYGTSIPVCCIVLSKSRKEGDPICFIDASKYFTPGKNMNSISDDDINRILNAYRGKEDIDKFCHMADMKEIESNDYNLNISRYVDTSEEEEEIDLQEVANEIRKVQAEINDTNKELKGYFDELGLDFPFEIH